MLGVSCPVFCSPSSCGLKEQFTWKNLVRKTQFIKMHHILFSIDNTFYFDTENSYTEKRCNFILCVPVYIQVRFFWRRPEFRSTKDGELLTQKTTSLACEDHVFCFFLGDPLCPHLRFCQWGRANWTDKLLNAIHSTPHSAVWLDCQWTFSYSYICVSHWVY